MATDTISSNSNQQNGAVTVQYDFEGYPACLRREDKQSYEKLPSSLHFHDELEFLYVYTGRLNLHINKIPITLLPTEGIFINSNQPHCIPPPPEDTCPCKEDCSFSSFLFHPSLLQSNNALNLSFVQPILHNPSVSFLHLSQSIPWQKDILNFLLKMEQCWDSPSATLHLQTLLFQIWEILYVNLFSDDRVPTSSLKAMVTFIHHAYAEKILLQDIANAGFVSKNTCITLFNRHLGISPTHYLNNYRLEKAAQLLVSTKFSVTAIALATGFSSPSYFVKLFRQTYGMNPTEYRKQETLKSQESP